MRVASGDHNAADRPRNTGTAAGNIPALKCRSSRSRRGKILLSRPKDHLSVGSEIQKHPWLVSIHMLPDPIDTGYDVSSDKSGCPRQDRYRDPLLHKIFLFDADRLKRRHAQGLTGIAPQQMAHGRIAGNDDMPDIRHLYPVFAKVFYAPAVRSDSAYRRGHPHVPHLHSEYGTRHPLRRSAGNSCGLDMTRPVL